MVFNAAGDAVHACVEAQRALAEHAWPEGLPVRVRMGLHTGAPVPHEDGYIGIDVHLAARIAAAAHGGQVVLSETTARLLDGRVPEGVRVVDVGRHRLKDIERHQRMHQLVIEGLPEKFPPLKTLGTTASLPSTLTPLLGRDGELREIGALLSVDDVRLVTLTGPGGSGKTRLATAVAAGQATRCPDGVFFVPLATATTAEATWTAIAATLGVDADGFTKDRLLDELERLHVMLVLDNLEQIPDAPHVVADLLARGRHLTVVATSRRPLHLPGEHEHPVPPLTLPHDAGLADAAASGAVQMFALHARMVRRDFEVSGANVADVTEICRRLDGLPLAIELAAARAKLLTPRALLARLHEALDLGAAGAGRPTRQQTLRAAVSWSYELLDDRSRGLFRRLGVFAGGCDLDAVAALVDDRNALLDDVAGLVDASLVTVHEDLEGEPRLGMLETIRTFALDRLEAEDDIDRVRSIHAQYIGELVEQLAPQLHGVQQTAAGDRLRLERDNIRLALTWSLPAADAHHSTTPDGVRRGIRVASLLRWFWHLEGEWSEAYRWYERAIALSPPDGPELASALMGLGQVGYNCGQEDTARDAARRALTIYRALGDDTGISEALGTLGDLEWTADRADAARACFVEGATLARTRHDNLRLGRLLSGWSAFESDLGNHDAAIGLVQEACSLAEQRRDARSALLMTNNLASLLCRAARFEEAQRLLPRLAAGAVRSKDAWLHYYVLGTAAEVLARTGHARRGTELLAMSDAIAERLGVREDPHDAEAIKRAFATAREALGEGAWQEAYDGGSHQDSEAALAWLQREVTHDP